MGYQTTMLVMSANAVNASKAVNPHTTLVLPKGSTTQGGLPPDGASSRPMAKTQQLTAETNDNLQGFSRSTTKLRLADVCHTGRESTTPQGPGIASTCKRTPTYHASTPLSFV